MRTLDEATRRREQRVEEVDTVIDLRAKIEYRRERAKEINQQGRLELRDGDMERKWKWKGIDRRESWEKGEGGGGGGEKEGREENNLESPESA